MVVETVDLKHENKIKKKKEWNEVDCVLFQTVKSIMEAVVC